MSRLTLCDVCCTRLDKDNLFVLRVFAAKDGKEVCKGDVCRHCLDRVTELLEPRDADNAS